MRIAAALLTLALAACSDDAPDLLTLRSDGPDEFAVMPGRTLELPPSYEALPEPGGTSRTAVDPRADAILALGGDPSRRSAGAVPAADGPLVAQVGRFGVQEGIREQLATEDLAFRRRNDARPLERLFGTNIYFKAYRSQSLDQYGELERFRRLGVATVAAPPPE